MLWQVRALLPDRPGAMAALASRCGMHGANILALDVHPSLDGEVVDELVIHAPDGWSRDDVEGLCREAGVFDSAVTPCSAHALEDQPTRYLRAARTVVHDPDRLSELLCQLLDAEAAPDVGTASLVLDDEAGPPVALRRAEAFTATETARANELRMVAAAATSRMEGFSSQVAVGRAGELRPGTVVDIRALTEMHDRCSAETLNRRYHSPVRRLTGRLARTLLLPKDGFSIVLPDDSGEHVVGFGMVAAQADGALEAALLVEDGWQRRGHGTALLRALATEAARRGAEELTLVTRREDTAVLATVHSAGLRAHIRCVDGTNRLRVPLPRVDATAPEPRPVRRRRTESLVALLHQRTDLRDVYAPADFIDRAVRDGV